jgi:hypothetical protein
LVEFVLDTAEVVQRTEEGAVERGDLGKDLAEEFGGGGVGESGDVEVFGSRAFSEEVAVEFGLDALEAALLPVGANERVDVELFEGGLGVELAVVLVGDGFVGGGVFAGNDDGTASIPY